MKEKYSHWFEPIAEHLSDAYLRYSFTYGTENEVDCLYSILELKAGDRLLDVGCGPGRHSNLFAEKGIDVLGIDISSEFIRLANIETTKAEFLRQDIRQMKYEGEFDAVVSMCQGGFGLLCDPESSIDNPDIDLVALENMARALKPGGKLALSAFSSYFQVQYLSDNDLFDASNGVNKEDIEIMNSKSEKKKAVTWTTCFTPRELRLMTQSVGLIVKNIWSVKPIEYKLLPCDIENPEFLLLAEKAT
jgi:SAM-dependent methyltransferase